jgi:signal transduction histidine kinase
MSAGPGLQSETTSPEATQSAIINILDDFASEKGRFEEGQRAALNILDDFALERARFDAVQRATLNILEDFDVEKIRADATQRASLNILEDFDVEKARADATQRASLNILDDFDFERVRMNSTQQAVYNILDDLGDEKANVERSVEELRGEVDRRTRAEEESQARATELEAVNKELEAFSYSVSHDLRAPLRAITGFSQALLEDYPHKLDARGFDYLQRVGGASKRMGELIDQMLVLSRVTRAEMRRERVDLSRLAQEVTAEVRRVEPGRAVDVVIHDGLETVGDSKLLRAVLENLVGNAWKFTSKHANALIEFGSADVGGEPAFFVKDDGAGFDPLHAEKLFTAFQRLHGVTEFPGTGIGLATVQRIIRRHGGRIWAEGAVEKGATFYFTLPERGNLA